MPKTALILVGGGTRGAIHGGACLAFEELGIRFDLTICVSVGICTGIFLNAGQVQNAYTVWTDYIPGDRFIRWRWGKPAMNIPYLLRCLRDVGKLDRDRVGSRGRLICVLTTIKDGAAAYLEVTPQSDPWRVIRASVAIPPFVRPITLGHLGRVADGGLSDPIPIACAIDQGCRDITVVLTRPRWRREIPLLEKAITRLALNREPRLSALAARAAVKYNAGLRLLRNPPKGVSVRAIYPPTFPWLHLLSTDSVKLRAWFWHGYRQARSMFKYARRTSAA